MNNLAFLTKQQLKRNAKFGFIFICCLLNACGNSSGDLTSESLKNLNKIYPSQTGGTLLDATIGEPSGLIYMLQVNRQLAQSLLIFSTNYLSTIKI